MAEKLVVRLREEFGKGFARRARVNGEVPGVVYGKGEETLHVLLPGHEIFLIVKDNRKAEVVLELDGKEINAKIQEVQVHPVRRDILHVDFVRI
ncbi:50S ribosomal protein L25 [Actinomyces sp. zg-332]|uniref:50S ribosomal protein L25 n=1 Tax=Actinomyces sp. zg-332 TaxID=2708340 RepID=UPI0014236C50|nr:50S ribosomal protein L25 [Actinomyces sp. zg-332]QPK94297.1 50S ribosomal protein L25 [Actinomyces sp. zg-332]